MSTLSGNAAAAAAQAAARSTLDWLAGTDPEAYADLAAASQDPSHVVTVPSGRLSKIVHEYHPDGTIWVHPAIRAILNETGAAGAGGAA